MKLDIVTWNIWGIPYGFSRERQERIGRLINCMHLHKPDIILLQEVFDLGDRKELSIRLPYRHPQNIYESRAIFGILPFDNTGGLVTYSRYPISKSVFQPFDRQGSGFDEWVSRKGYTKTHVITDEGDALVVNTHLSSWSWNSKARVEQLEQLTDDTDIMQAGSLVIMGGDFNFDLEIDEEAASEELDVIEAAGFSQNPSGKLDMKVNGNGDLKTFCRRNFYMGEKDMADLSRDMQLDGIFVKMPDGKKVVSVESGLVGTARGKEVSDHYGLRRTYVVEKR